MARNCIRFALALLLVSGPEAHAAVLNIQISDTSGAPAPNAVISLVAQSQAGPPVSNLAADAVVDQRRETFIPLVTVIRKGGRIVFTNNDTTMHQVYSFSPIKQFEFEIDKGHRSEPVIFEKPGVASIGCNIHDRMITYVFVSDTPWAALSDSNGHAKISEIPAGDYRIDIWHPRLRAGTAPSSSITLRGDTNIGFSIPLLIATPAKHMHMGIY